MRKMVKRLSCILLAFVLAVCMLPGNLLYAVQAADTEYGIPARIEGQWEYVGTNPDGTQGLAESFSTVWSQGNAYGVTKNDTGKAYLRDLIDTTSASYRQSYEALTGDNQFYNFARDLRITILYLPNCPYSKSMLPKFQRIAGNAGVKVMLVDVTKYSVSLYPYYDSVNIGAVSPVVMYLDQSQSVQATGRAMPMGQSRVHTTADFVEILKKAGYSNVADLPNGSEPAYSQEEEFERRALMETNRQRLAHGLLPLATTEKLEAAADVRVREIVNQMSHTRPNNEYFSTAIDKEIPYASSQYVLAENLAGGAIANFPERTVTAWMGSSGHRANILREAATHLSVSYYNNKGGSGYADYWVQLFLGSANADNLRLSQPSISVIKGVPISDMDIDLVFDSNLNGTQVVSRIPLIDEMCTGYDNTKAGLQPVTVHYRGQTVTLEVQIGDIDPVQLTSEMVSFSENVDNLVYDGLAKTPQVSVSSPTGAYTLIEGYSYQVSYSDNINAGQASVTITGKGNYTGSVTKTFTIKPRSISGMNATGLASSYEYTGEQVLPAVQLLNGTQKLYEGTDFTVSYGENIGTPIINSSGVVTGIDGKGTVTLTGTGNYTGTLTKEFDFTVPDLYNFASRFDYIIYFDSNHSSLFDRLNSFYQEYLTAVENGDNTAASIAELKVEATRDSYTYINGKLEEAGYTIKDVLAYPNYPGQQLLHEKLNDYYRFYAMVDGKITMEDAQKADIQPAEVSSDVPVSNVTVEGLVPNASSQSTKVALAVDNASDAAQLQIDATQYDTVSAVALDIQMLVDGQAKQPQTPVTITMDIPDGLNPSDNLVVLHYHDGTGTPEQLPVTVKGNTMSFVTEKFSAFVVTRQVESYSSGLMDPSQSNDPAQSGVSFGEEDDLGPEAAQNVTAVLSDKNTATVSWGPAAATAGWTINGYRVSWSESEDFSSLLGSREVGSETNSLDIPGLTTGRYYFKVTTLASSQAVSSMERDSLTASILLSGSQNDQASYYTLTVHNGSGSSVQNYLVNQQVNLTADPADEGMAFDRWEVEAGELVLANPALSQISFYMPQSHVVLRAVYRQLAAGPDEEQPDVDQPDTDQPDTGEPEQPGTGEPEQPGTGEPEQPGTDQPDNSNPGWPDGWLPGGNTGGGNSSGSVGNGGSNRPDPSKPVVEWNRDEDGTRLTVDGEMVTGWYQDENGWHWFDQQSGIMAEDSWEKVNGVWYLLGKDGVMLTGWQKVDGKWYYLKDWGGMASGWQQIGGVWYYLRGNGAMASDSWVKSGGSWYYLRGNGEMATNRWVEWKGDWYFLYSTGAMAANTTIDGYRINADGVWVK